jgi:hypothetical protein
MTIKGGLKQDTEARSCNHSCFRKAKGITYVEYMFVALGIQHVKCMRHIVICGQTCPAIFFSIISQTARKMLLNVRNICDLTVPTNFSEKFLILRRIERDTIKNVQYIGLHVECP